MYVVFSYLHQNTVIPFYFHYVKGAYPPPKIGLAPLRLVMQGPRSPEAQGGACSSHAGGAIFPKLFSKAELTQG
jgi:hypothetical protein